MPEYRQNPLTRQWVILSSERQSRPSEFLDQPARRDEGTCPFCLGNEHETPPALATYIAPGQQAWSVRVVPNKYPAVMPHSGNGQVQTACADDCLFRTAPSLGEHEVIIESPRHVASVADLSLAETKLLFQAYRDRLAVHRGAGNSRYVQIFKNVGSLAGASIEHSHSQLMALADLPQEVEREISIADSYQRRHGRSVLSALVEAELKAEDRVIAQSASYVAFCPFASRFPYEVCIAAKNSSQPFDDLETGKLGELATFVRESIGRIEHALGPVAYNYYLKAAPFDTFPVGQYDWHIEIFPRLVKVAAFEWSTGIFINTVSPEAAAELLRSSPGSGVERLRGSKN